METTLQRFESKITKAGPDDCWLFQGGQNGTGYGRFWFAGKLGYVHRYAYQQFVGPIPEGMCVLHHCDIRNCVNPSHLFTGTKLDNTRDMITKGREIHQAGAENGRAKLTESDVLEIRLIGRNARLTWAQIAYMYGVSRRAIGFILHRVTWKHLVKEIK